GWSPMSIPLGQFVAGATILGAIGSRDLRPLPRCREVYLLLALWIVFFLSTIFAVFPDNAWPQFFKVSKILIMTVMTLLLFQDIQRIRALLWVIALSIGFFGFKGGLWALFTGGGNMVLGPPGSFISGNTEIGMAMNMVLPIFLFLRREEKRGWVRHFLLVLFGLSVVAILITYSRGAFLGLAVVLSMLFLKSRAKVLALLLLTTGVPLAMSTLPEKWFTRMETIQTYEEDQSAMARIRAWGVAYDLAMDHPILGAGFRPFNAQTYREYTGEAGRSDAH